jgi:hypothetical protein
MQQLPQNCKTLYYPGCGDDYEVFFYFAEHSKIKNFYYCEYLQDTFSSENVIQKFNKKAKNTGYTIEYFAEFTPKSFNANSWNDFWHPDSKKKAFGKPKHAYASIYKIKKGKQSWNLYFFGTEAIGTYKILLQNNIKPEIVVVQDHGLGCFWTEFAGDSYLYNCAYKAKCLPRYILLGLKQDPWPKYASVSKPFGAVGCYKHERELFRLQNKLKPLKWN